MKFAAPGFTGPRRAPLRGFAPLGRRPPTFALRALLAAFFIGFTPGAARGPLDTDRMIAGLRIFYAPRTDLREIDLAVLASARESIDIAAFTLESRRCSRVVDGLS